MESSFEPSATRAGAWRQATVLVLEDDFWTRYTAAKSLCAMGHRVIEGQDASEVCASTRSLISTCPALSTGWLLQTGSHHPHIPVLLTSGVPQHAGATPAAGLRRFVAKPYDRDEVDRLLRAML